MIPEPGLLGGPSLEDRAAARAFLARGEVRLSTLHRIAVGLLSGAGLLVVLPVVARDSVTGIMRALVIGEFALRDALLLIGIGAVLATPIVALWLLFSDLTRFYFHANHLAGQGRERFTARFTLVALRLPADELSPAAARALGNAQRERAMIELLVPSNDVSRRRIDRQLRAYGAFPTGLDDFGRAEGLFDLASSTRRSLLDEVARMEYGLARHILKLRGLVLRYVKAVLALLSTALAVYASDAVVVGLDSSQDVSAPASVWLSGVVLIWTPLVVLAITAPVRWIEELMRDEGDLSTAIADDPEMTRIERVTLWIAAAGWIASAAAMVSSITDEATGSAATVGGLLVMALSAAVLVIAGARGRFRSLRPAA